MAPKKKKAPSFIERSTQKVAELYEACDWLAETDADAVRAYADAWIAYEILTAKLEALDDFFVTSERSGLEQPSSVFQTWHRAAERVNVLGTRLGLNPLARKNKDFEAGKVDEATLKRLEEERLGEIMTDLGGGGTDG